MESTNKRSTLKVVLVTLGVVVGLVVIIGGLFIYWAYQTTKSFSVNDRPLIIADVDNFISDVNQGKLNDAAALADPQNLSLSVINGNLSQIQSVFRGYEKQDSNFSSYNIQQFASGKQVTYQTIAYFSDNTQGTLSVVAAQENGVWKLEGIHINASPSHINGDVVERGDEVNPTLQTTIINAYESQKSIYLGGDLSVIRQHMMLADPSQAQEIASTSDTDLKNINLYQIQAINTAASSPDVFRSHDAIWTFNKGMTSVTIQLPLTATSTNGQVGNIGERGSYSNGQWYF